MGAGRNPHRATAVAGWAGRVVAILALTLSPLAVMAQELGESPYCKGIHYSLADVAVGCALGWLSFRFPELDWRSEHANLARLYDKLSERQSFKDTVPQ